MNYESLKSLVKKILPTHFVYRNQDTFRKIVALRYLGNRYTCNLCSFGLSQFITLSNGDLLCPNCGSLPRTRRLWDILEDEIANGQKKILHFSPSRGIAKKLKRASNIEYITTDYIGEFEADRHFDITNIDEPDEKYDLIICFHVLEHIEEDVKAMRELFRVLKPAGKAFIQTPFKEGEIYENPAIQTPSERLKHFGQEDHVRIYSVTGLKSRLEKEGFMVSTHLFENDAENEYGFKEREIILIGEKPPRAS